MFHLFHSFAKTLSNQGRGSLTPAQLKEGTGHQLPATGQMIQPRMMPGEAGPPIPCCPAQWCAQHRGSLPLQLRGLCHPCAMQGSQHVSMELLWWPSEVQPQAAQGADAQLSGEEPQHVASLSCCPVLNMGRSTSRHPFCVSFQGNPQRQNWVL